MNMRPRIVRVRLTNIVGALVGLALTGLAPNAPPAPLSIYDDALNTGWQDWSWNTTVNLNNSAPVHGGSHSVAATYLKAWAGLYLHADPAVNLAGYDTLRFYIHGGSAGGQRLRVVANGSDGQTFAVTAPANAWTPIDVPLAALGNPAALIDLFWQDTTDGPQATFYLDDIQLINSGLPIPTPVPPGVGPALSVHTQADAHPISPDIYGLNDADEALAADLNLPVRRRGGNNTSRYNWQSDLSNTGSDWYFENIPQGGSVSTLPDGSAADLFVEQDRRTGTRTIMTVPLIGWVAKSSSPRDHPFACGFKVSKYGAQQANDWEWDADCGNGVLTNGQPITTNSPLDTSTAISPTFVQGWVKHLIGRYGTAANGGVKFYNLDNEPMLWNSTHRDVHPLPTSYDEMRDQTYAYAAALKAADASAQTLGPVLWGWCAYFYSAVDGCGAGSDYAAHNDTPFVPWYLQQMQSYEQQHGTRILDYLDLHDYPQADGVSLSGAGDAATQALRLRSTRSLWDATYIDESWISDTAPGGVAVRLIPRMREWVNANYPGTKLAMTEYNWGALDHINGALAQADVLGIFGREGIDLAALWGPPASTEPGAFAFRLYRNYDGQHHTFGETGVRAASADQDRVAIYAAKRGVDGALTLMIINKSPTQTLTSVVSLSGFDPLPAAPVYRYSAANLNAIVRQADQAVGPGDFTAVFPASSITLIVVPPGMPLDKHVYLPLTLKSW
jgi:hypothetical protein